VAVTSVTPGGGHGGKAVYANSAPVDIKEYTALYPAGAVRVSGSTSHEPDVPGYGGSVTGLVVMGSSLYNSGYLLTEDGEVVRPSVTTSRVGGGWGDTTFFETTRYWREQTPEGLTTQYQLRSDGTLTRWTMDLKRSNPAPIWADRQSVGGFAAVKTMAMISQTLTYDTFLANTRGGALYTIRLPRTSPMKPIVKKVRASTWQGFEAMVISKCGQYGTMLVAIDKDTQSAHAYAIGHANGTATVIQGLGKVPATFADPVYFHRQIRAADAHMLFGE